jgi:hypothetical protein
MPGNRLPALRCADADRDVFRGPYKKGSMKARVLGNAEARSVQDGLVISGGPATIYRRRKPMLGSHRISHLRQTTTALIPPSRSSTYCGSRLPERLRTKRGLPAPDIALFCLAWSPISTGCQSLAWRCRAFCLQCCSPSRPLQACGFRGPEHIPQNRCVCSATAVSDEHRDPGTRNPTVIQITVRAVVSD